MDALWAGLRNISYINLYTDWIVADKYIQWYAKLSTFILKHGFQRT